MAVTIFNATSSLHSLQMDVHKPKPLIGGDSTGFFNPKIPDHAGHWDYRKICADI